MLMHATNRPRLCGLIELFHHHQCEIIIHLVAPRCRCTSATTASLIASAGRAQYWLTTAPNYSSPYCSLAAFSASVMPSVYSTTPSPGCKTTFRYSI